MQKNRRTIQLSLSSQIDSLKQAYNMGGLPRPVSSGHVPGLIRGNAPHEGRTQAPSSSTNSFNIVDLSIPSGLSIQRGTVMIGRYLIQIILCSIIFIFMVIHFDNEYKTLTSS